MSVVVKGMRMPENCIECISSDLRTAIKCTEWTEISAGRRENERAWSCPLVDLGKHGDLIDADKLIIDLMDRGLEGVQTDDYSEIQQTILVQDTVIEAEEEA